ncbi:terminase small subunit [Clostridium algidicarnis]|uniref:terminase small subunit n=1 Tax=Clostridium algidicarnis TaxID=37659 RepID=UPI001C0B39DB|nr:terminase small subunit [Clostridium algidicarnis]
MSKLTPKQKIFVDEYLVDLNATRAYKVAYPNCKKEETAAQAGSRLLRNVKVKEHIDKRMKDREKRTEVTQDKVLQELAKIGFADIKDYLEYKTAKTVVQHDENGEPVIDYQQIVNVIDSKEVDTSVIQEVSIGKDGTFKFKLYDKQKALVDIGKHLGMFTDKVEVKGNLSVNNPFEGLTTEQLLKIAGEEDG